jgi:hypothetical protein
MDILGYNENRVSDLLLKSEDNDLTINEIKSA